MKTKIVLLYFKGCPNVEQTRENLRQALQASAFTEKTWSEVDVNDPLTPREWRGFPSPTVLVNGFNAETGERSAEGGGACRLGGAPGAEILVTGLLSYGVLT